MLVAGAWAGDAAAPSPDQGLLLLRNGQMLEGKISRVEGLHVVELPGGQIRVKNADVDMVCTSLAEAYRRKAAAIRVGDVGQHLDLAQWCLRHRLFDQSADELSRAAQADPTNPLIGLLRHRLEMAQQPPPAQGTKQSQPILTNEELDRMVGSLPRGAVETFTQSVQPMLMNHCMSAGCHGAQTDNGPQLFRVPANRAAGRRLTQRNLYALLQYIDREKPADSRLLKAIIGPHGTSRSPIFSDHQAAQYQHLVDWVNQVAHTSAVAAPLGIAQQPVQENPTLALPTAPGTSAPGFLPQEARRATPMHVTRAGRGSKPHSPPSAESPTEASPVAHTQPADPFDPEAFNNLPAGKR